jgi:site-specific recombinase XerD
MRRGRCAVLLGHQSLDSTAIYTRVAPLDLAKAIETAHPREKNWRPKKVE